jgi:7-cyano-7-deazaguanine tRNA-ribosyltransferase
MSFDIRSKDLLGRIGRLKTRSGTVETPTLLPVINPGRQTIPPRILQEELGCDAVITNAYILRKQCAETPVEIGVHRFLDFDGVIMTDSGAYQILEYGEIDVSPIEIVHFQEQIATDIATILDIPTGFRMKKRHSERTVKETLKRAEDLARIKTRSDILWVGPIQGGQYLDLVAHSARNVGRMPFDIHALGSPTPIMEQYLFDTLVNMILTAKMNIPLNRPFHLFGAGHPFMFALAVALGCDLFDSAAYAIYAKQDRYMTAYGTSKLRELEYFPCSCPTCVKYEPRDLAALPSNEKHVALAKHNLYASFEELKRVKQRIVEGRLWEHLESRAHAHPALLQAVKLLKKHADYIERHSPATKTKGLFFFSSLGLSRPEIVRYRRLFSERHSARPGTDTLLLLPQPRRRPFHKDKMIRNLLNQIQEELPEKQETIEVCVYSAPLGVIPLELSEVYPLSQHEIAEPLDLETIHDVAEHVRNYVGSSAFKKVVLVEASKMWKGRISEVCQSLARKGLSITFLRVEAISNKEDVNHIVETLRKALQGDPQRS